MTDEKLVEELRDPVYREDVAITATLGEKAADRIEAQAALIAELERERDGLKAHVTEMAKLSRKRQQSRAGAKQ